MHTYHSKYNTLKEEFTTKKMKAVITLVLFQTCMILFCLIFLLNKHNLRLSATIMHKWLYSHSINKTGKRNPNQIIPIHLTMLTALRLNYE